MKKMIIKNNILFLLPVIVFLFFAIYISDKLSYAIVNNKVFDSYNSDVYFLDAKAFNKEFEIDVQTNNLIGLHIPFFSSSDDVTFTVKAENKVKKNSCHSEVRLNKDKIKFMDINFYPTLTKLKGKKLNISISASDYVSFLFTDENKTNLEYKQYGFGSKKVQIILFMIFLFGCLLFLSLILLCLKLNVKSYNLYLILAIVFGFVNIFVVPPLNQPDAITHYESIYNFSNKMLNLTSPEGYIYKRVCDLNFLPNYYKEGYIVKNSLWIGDVKAFLRYISEEYSFDKDISLILVPKYRTVAPRLEYVPQAILMTIGRWLKFNQFFLYFFVLLGNYALMVSIIYHAVKYAGDNSLLFFLLGLNPVILYVIQSVSYDPIIFSMSLLVISLAYKIFISEKISKKISIISIICSILLFPMKTIYFPISLLIPVALFSKNKLSIKIQKQYIISFSLISVMLFCFIMILKYGSANESYYSLGYVFFNPIKSFMVFLRTLFGGSAWYSFSSSSFGFMNSKLEILLLFISLMFPLSNKISKKHFVYFVSSYIFVYLLVFLVGFSWTDSGNRIIWGLQDRYFYPIWPLLMLSAQRYLQNRINLEKRIVLLIVSLLYFSQLLMGIVF